MEEKKVEITLEKKKKGLGDYIKMGLKVILYVFLCLFVLNSILYITLSIPSVQNKLVRFASDELSKMLNTKVSVSEVNMSLFNRISLKDLYIEDQAKDSLVYAETLGARISPINFLLQNRLKITKVKLDNFFINVNAADSISDYNFQFIIDSFSSDTDSTTVDTTSSSLDIVIDDIKITNGRLAYRIKSDSVTPEIFNPSDIYLTDFNASVSVHSIDMNNLNIHVNGVMAKEKSGLELTKLEGHILSDSTCIRVEDLLLSLPESHLMTDTLFYDTKTEEFMVVTRDTEILPNDLIPFLPSLKYLDQKISLKTKIRGKLPAINLEDILLTYGDEARLDGNAFISSYANLGGANLGAEIKTFSITPKGIESFAKLGDETFQVPEQLDSLGRVTLDGNLSGKLSAFHLESKGWMEKNPGELSLIADGNIDTTFTKFDVKANLAINRFNLVPFVGEDAGVGKLSVNVDLDAQQRGEGTLTAKVKGKIDSLELMHGAVEALPFVASYSPDKIGFGADAKLHFGHFQVGFDMTTDKKPDIRFGMRVKDIDVAHFYQNKYWKEPLLSFDIKGRIDDLDIDNLNADFVIKDLKFVDEDFNYTTDPITLKAWQETAAHTKYITLNSSLFSAKVKGDYKFSTLMDEYSELMNKYLPSVFPTDKVAHHHHHGNNFTFDFTLNNTEELGYIFDLPVDIIKPLVVKGEINTEKHKIDIAGNLPLARTSSLDIKDVNLNVANLDSAFNIRLKSGLSMSGGNYDLALNINGANDLMRSTFTVGSDASSIQLEGKVDAMSTFTLDENKKLISTFEVIPTDIQIGKFVMNLLPAKITNLGERTEVENVGIGINNKKYLDIDGVISPSSQDSLFIKFSKAQVADILQGFNVNYINAEINGDIVGTNLLSAPELYTEDLKVSDITVYKDTLGTLTVNTMWSPEVRGILLASNLKHKGREVMELNGITQPEIKKLSLQLDVERFSIGWAKPFAEGLLSDISGDISSHLTINGTYDEPITEGFLGFNNTKIGIEYTNVNYYISDTIDITPQRIGFDNLVMKDAEGNTGTVSANLTHRNFKNMKYNLNLRARNLMVLNTQSRTDSLFYGKLFASGNVRIDGSDKGINMNMQLRNGKKSNLNITIPQVSEATNYKSVVYINVPEDKLPKEDTRWRREEKEKEEEIPINIKLKLDIDPELNLGVVIDPATGDRMTVKGRGTINFSYDMAKELMTTFGDYNITEGGVRLNLQNISKLEFRIKDGSKLNFIGDPFQTKFNITAYRRVRADLRTLDVSFEQDNASPRVQVDCLLGISGNMNKMDLKYDIELVGASEDQVRKVKSLVNTDEIRIRQFAYLIASGTFYSNTGSSGANFSDGMWTSLASNALSTGLNAVFGSMLGENWEFGADISDTDRSVSASTRLLDNKLKLSANVGMRSENSSSATDNSFIGDFDAEYMLNSTWTIKAYSHTNDRFYRQAPTTQGVGLVFTREGPTFKQMFKSIGRRRGDWFRQERDSIRAVKDSIKIVEDSLELRDKAIQDSIKVEKEKIDKASSEKTDSHRTHSSKHGVQYVDKKAVLREEDD